jgi:thiamine-phosphate pyrophosphorylase
VSLSTEKPLVYLITKGEATPANFPRSSREILEIIRVAVDQGVDLIQIREKQLPARLVYELACEAAKITGGSNTSLLVNDRADVASAANADGVHLTSTSLTPDIIRDNFRSDFIIGISVHTSDDALIAQQQGADFVVYGPVFDTPGKGPAVGIKALSDICETLSPFPVLALGGVGAHNYLSVLQAGASGFASIRALNDVGSMRAICRELKK